MVTLLGRLRAAWRFTRLMAWTGPRPWDKDDAIALQSFMRNGHGKKLALVLRDTCIAQNAAALAQKDGLQYAAGFAMGQAALVTLLETLASPDSISDGRQEPEPADNPNQ